MTTEPLILRARWAKRRASWGDNHCLQFRLPNGSVVGVGAPSKEQALAAAKQHAEAWTGRTVHFTVINPSAR